MASNPRLQQFYMSSSSLIWFQLYDSSTGEPYKRTSASKIYVSSSADVDDFRDAVKAKYEQPTYLKDIPAGSLFVYKNKSAFVGGNEESLKPSCLLDGFGITEEDALIVVVPSETSSPGFVRIEREIKSLEDSEEFKTLASKNRAWAVPKPTDQEKGEWQLLMEKLADLKKKEDFYRNAFLSTNAHSVKKSEITQKGYKKDTAIKDERLLLSDVAIKMWERFRFTLQPYGMPTFGDFQWAAGFKDDDDVRDYFQKKANGEVKEDIIKESFSEKQWIWLIRLDQRVNLLLHDTLITKQDGSLRLVLEHDVYQDGVDMAEELVRTLYGSSKKVDIKDASTDS
jgi:hypothetical protein